MRDRRPANDLDALRRSGEPLRASVTRRLQSAAACRSQNDRLRHLLRQLAACAVWSAVGDGLIPTSCSLALEDIETGDRRAAMPRGQERPGGSARPMPRARRRANRGALPAHLPRIHVTIEPDDTACPCCQGAMHVIGEETVAASRRDPGAVSG